MTSHEDLQKISDFLLDKIPADARLVVIGVGNNQRQDDEAGLLVVQNLIKEIPNIPDDLLLIEGIGAPEYYIHEINEWKPTFLLMIDAADFSMPPGTIRIIQREHLSSNAVSGHSLSKKTLLDFLVGFNPTLQVYIIGIQAASISINEKMTEHVVQAVQDLTGVLQEIIMKKEK